MTDALTDILTTLRMRGTLYFRTDFRAPWGVEVPANAAVARFHLLLRGEAWIEAGGENRRMRRGDLALVPHGATHHLRDMADRPTVPLNRVLDSAAYDGTTDLRYGGDGESAVLVCGHFAFDDELLHPVLEEMPPLIHLTASDGQDFSWLDGATRAVAFETATRPPGWSAVVDRISAIVFIQALRASIQQRGLGGSVFGAFADPHLRRALGAIHADPSAAWTVDTLARRAGMSRTVFAERFRQRIGMAPVAYLTRWRLQRARRVLLDSDDTVALVAAAAGYRSEAAFSRAFSRAYGVPPARYRRARSAQAVAR